MPRVRLKADFRRWLGSAAVPRGVRYPPLRLTPQQQRQWTLETVLTVLRALAAQ
jgi:hypothetical protein